MAIERTSNSIHIHQKAFVEEFISPYFLEGTPKKRVPMDDGIDLYAITNDPTYPEYDSSLADPTKVRSFVGGFAWPTDTTRPDLAWFRMQFARQQHRCSQKAFEIMRESIYYLHGTSNLGITYFKDTDFPDQPITFCDAGFAQCITTRSSNYSLVTFLNGGPVYWKSKMIKGTPSDPTMAGEIVPLYESWRFLKHYHAYMSEIGHPPKLPLLIYGDNQSANKFGLTARWTQENRHLDVKYMVLAANVTEGS
jgi:hypothetical protein